MKVLRILTVFLFAIVPLSVFAMQPESGKANTIDELAKMYDVASCKQCHMIENKKGHFMPAYRDSDEAKNAVKVDIDTMGYYFLPRADDSIPMAVVTVKITSNAGHRIPDG